ncbi:MAG: FtsX-like permease family protein [Aggregatilineales bacterium]|nr:FtsX-like permease family protein [Chloroflexota bacterium]HOA24329.1 ABC transporter permease [Aggregatilineales bacterium]HPV06542.1 ABC transporter permease [Aggregatilineales bacterium]
MTFRDLIRLVWSNLRRMRGRALMTALGVLIGTAAIVVLISLAAGLRQSAVGDLSQFGPVNQITVLPGAIFQSFGATGISSDAVLTPRRLEEIARMDGVTAVTPREQVAVPTTIKLDRLVASTTLTGIDARAVRAMGTLAQGSPQLGRWTAIVGARVGEQFVDPRRRTTVQSDEPLDLYGRTLQVELTRVEEDGKTSTRTVRLRVGGVLAEGAGQDDYSIFIALEDAEDLVTWYQGQRPDRRNDGYSQAVIIVDDPEKVLKIEQELLLEGFLAFSARSTLQQINVIFAVIQAAFGGIGAIALIVAAIGIANTMIMSILERTREIGLMKALGATNRDVMSIFIAEAGAIGLLGGVGGVVFGAGIAKIIDLIAQAYINNQLAASGATGDAGLSLAVIPLWLPVFAIVFSLIIGLASGIYPALRAVQLDPVKALKYE